MKTIDIKGNSYVMVNERIKYFRENYSNGAILTDLISDVDGKCIFKAEILVDGECRATGYAYENEGGSFINKTSYIENCETSSIGRALGNLGIGIDESVASFEEVANAISNQGNNNNNTSAPPKIKADNKVITFGKHKGKKWSEVDDGFLTWLISNFENKEIIEIAEKELAYRKEQDLPEGFTDEIPF